MSSRYLTGGHTPHNKTWLCADRIYLAVMLVIWDGLDRRGRAGKSLIALLMLQTPALTRFRCFEFLGACGSGNTTPSPGPKSFTKALIWALICLARDETRFTISGLSRKIREAPNFPKNQVPVQLDRGAGSIERIILAPLPQTTGQTESSSNESQIAQPKGLLNLNFIFDQPPTEAIITQFGNNLNKFINREKMPVDRIVWGGLTSWEGVQPSPGAHKQKLAAAKAFKKAGDRRKSVRKQREMNEDNSALALTPVSSVEEGPPPSSPPSNLSQPPTKKSRLSNEH